MGRSRGWPLSVVVMVTGGGSLNFGSSNLLFCEVAMKLRFVNLGINLWNVLAVLVKLQKERIHLYLIQLRDESLNCSQSRKEPE
jgi:hypothetical protein